VEVLPSKNDDKYVDPGMQILGLNDIVYVVPDYTINEYDNLYPDTALNDEAFKGFFERWLKWEEDTDNNVRNDSLPQIMKFLDKNLCTAVENESKHGEAEWKKGKAYINLKNIPNGHYTLYYIRIGQPVGINSQLAILGKAKNLFVNIDRSLLNQTMQA